MHLTKEEEKILDGENGEVMGRLFRLLVRLGEIYGADKMIPVGSVQVAGVSYKSIGDPGTEFLEDLGSILQVWILKTGKNLVFQRILQRINYELWMRLKKWV